ncbi:SusC/RagA family TonB-linked outer membrane protein [Neotamlana nanhaiensis]|nr:TonB-dependent receptor [Tamlana nanhaiensis]
MKKQKLLILFLLFGFLSVSWGQSNIAGVVIDEEGIPLSGASVTIIGTATGAITDFDGGFNIKASVGDVLEVSYLGYNAEQITISDLSKLKITLTSNDEELDAVVVVGYGTQKKSDVTGAIGSLQSESFNKGVVANAGQLLQGKVAGVNVSNVTGEPGSGQDIVIRGVGSLRSGTTPLYVVDGFALDNSGNGVPTNPLNFINPQDIESIDVLKDASAAAIYGARAANGVIVITTKKGKKGRMQMNLTVSAGLSKIANKIDVFTADEFRQQVVAVGGELSDGGANTDWQDELTRTAVTKKTNFSLSGGTESSNYYASVGVDDIQGILRNNDLKRYSARVNATQKAFKDKLKIEFNVAATRTENVRPDATSIITDMLELNPTVPVYTNGLPTELGDRTNPIVTEKVYRDFTNNNRILANIAPSIEIFKGLTYRLNLGVDYSTANRDVQTMPLAEANVIEGFLNTYTNENKTTQVENTLTYNFASENHSLTALVGQSYQENFYTSKRWSYDSFPDNGIEPRYQIGIGNLTGDSASAVINELQSFFGRVNYAFANKYMLTATMRADGSSKFGSNNKYGYFPSVAAGWNISNESFMENGPFSNLKLRASWGQTGNQEIPSKITKASYGESGNDNDIYPLTEGVVNAADYPLGLVYSRTANPDIQWEVSTQTNIGLDFGILNNQLTGSVDYFNKVSENVLLEVVPADPIQPTTTYWTNIPNMEIKNNGVEVALDYQSDATRDFTFNIGGNFSLTKNKVENSPYQVLTTGAAQGSGQSGATINGYINNEPIGAFYMREFLGIDGEGFSIYRDINDDGAIDDRDRTIAGSALPDYLYAFYLNFNYKNFDLGLNFNGAGGNKIYNHTRMSSFNIGNIQGSANTTDQAVQYPNESPLNSNVASTRYLEDGDFLRLNNATLGYNLDPKKVGINDWVNAVRISLTGENLFVITKYTGFDPEVNTGSETGGIKTFGIDRYTYPKARTFLLSLNVSF